MAKLRQTARVRSSVFVALELLFWLCMSLYCAVAIHRYAHAPGMELGTNLFIVFLCLYAPYVIITTSVLGGTCFQWVAAVRVMGPGGANLTLWRSTQRFFYVLVEAGMVLLTGPLGIYSLWLWTRHNGNSFWHDGKANTVLSFAYPSGFDRDWFQFIPDPPRRTRR